MSGHTGNQRATAARRLAATIAVLALILIAVLYGPMLASGNYHRATIERMATDALGRRVTIAGPIQLSILPEPQLRADTITIGSPKGGQITAATLKLDLATGPLLLGRLRATKLTLRKPDVALPWPLPGGAHAIAPPPWLASLHATIVDGTFHLGSLAFHHADLSIFTGGPNAVLAASGSAVLDGQTIAATLDIADTGGNAPAPITAKLVLASDQTAKFSFKGTLDRASTLIGTLTGRLPGALIANVAKNPKFQHDAAFTASLAATGTMVAFRVITATIGTSQIAGHAIVALDPAPLLRLDLTGRHWSLGQMLDVNLLSRVTSVLPIAASLDLTDSSFDQVGLKSLKLQGISDGTRHRLQFLSAALPGGATLTIARQTTQTDETTSSFHLSAPSPNTTIAGLRPALSYLPNWPTALGPLAISGTMSAISVAPLNLTALHGTIGGPKTQTFPFTGALTLSATADHAKIAADLGFDRLVLTDQAVASLAAGAITADGALSGPFDLHVRHLLVEHTAERRGTPLLSADSLMLDGALKSKTAGGGIALDLATLRIGKALLIAHGARLANGGIVASRLLLTGPDAGATARLLAPLFNQTKSPWLGLGILHHRFAASLVAAGPATAVHAGLTLHLGTIRAAGLPVIDLNTATAAGPLTLHAPNAAILIADLGGTTFLGAHHGLEWPGAGSASLRAAAFATPTMIGLSDAVLALGALTASGSLTAEPRATPLAITGSITADTLAIPTPATLLALATNGLAHHLTISLPIITAATIDHAGTALADHATMSFGLTQGKDARSLTLGIDHAEIAGGTLDGTAVLDGASSPTLNLAGHLIQADAAAVAADASALGLPLPLTAGSIDLATRLTAQGDTITAWRKTLAGTLTAAATNITLAGIDLAAAGTALEQAIAAQPPAALKDLRLALATGATNFDTATIDTTIAAGMMTLAKAQLTGKAGTIGATGTIDLLKPALNLHLTAQPTVTASQPAPALRITILGPLDRLAIQRPLGAAKSWVAARSAP